MLYILGLCVIATFWSSSKACTSTNLRECTEMDDTFCCKPLIDSSLKMEIGIKAGNFIMVRKFFTKMTFNLVYFFLHYNIE